MAKSIVFFGSSAYSIPSLETLMLNQVPISCVITTQDKPAGRHLKLTPNPLKQFALHQGLTIIENAPSFSPSLIKEGAGGVALVAAYGKIIPQSVIDAFNNQIYNIHPSLLPKYRGASPLQTQILEGIKETGVTVIQLDAKMDHGPIVAQEKDVIFDSDTPESLGKRLFIKGTELFIRNLSLGQLLPQNDSQATYTKKLTREDGFIEYTQFKKFLDLGFCDLDIPRMHRAYAGWPGIWSTTPEGKRVKLLAISPKIVVQEEGSPPRSMSI